MQRTKLVAVGALWCISVGGALLAVNPAPALAAETSAELCTNTYCLPGDNHCVFLATWDCYLDGGGCLAVIRCGVS